MKGQETKENEFEKSLYLNFIWTENLGRSSNVYLKRET